MRGKLRVAGVVALLVIGLACKVSDEDVILTVGSTTGDRQANVAFVVDGVKTDVGRVNLPWTRRRSLPDAFAVKVTGTLVGGTAKSCITCAVEVGDRVLDFQTAYGPNAEVTCVGDLT